MTTLSSSSLHCSTPGRIGHIARHLLQPLLNSPWRPGKHPNSQPAYYLTSLYPPLHTPQILHASLQKELLVPKRSRHRPPPDLCSGPFCPPRIATEPRAPRGSLEESEGGWSQARSLCGFVTVDQDMCHPSNTIRIFLHSTAFPRSLVAHKGPLTRRSGRPSRTAFAVCPYPFSMETHPISPVNFGLL